MNNITNNDSLYNRMKLYEEGGEKEKLEKGKPVLIKFDGKNFAKFCYGLEKPYDERFSHVMIEVAKRLMSSISANCGFVYKDKIILVLNDIDKTGSIIFNGKIQKMISVLSGLAVTNLAKYTLIYLPTRFIKNLPYFRCNVFQTPTIQEAVNYFVWSEIDCVRWSVLNLACRYLARSESVGKTIVARKETLKNNGIIWDNFDHHYKHGTYIQKIKVIRKFTERELRSLPKNHIAKINPEILRERNDFRTMKTCIKEAKNKVRFVFCGENPIF